MSSTSSSTTSRPLRRALPLATGLALAAGVFLAHAGLGIDVVARLPDVILCPFRWLTGIDCPGCGMTRALLRLAQLRVHEALALHPLAPLLVAGLGWAALAPRSARRAGRGAAPALLGLVLATWALRQLA